MTMMSLIAILKTKALIELHRIRSISLIIRKLRLLKRFPGVKNTIVASGLS